MPNRGKIRTDAAFWSARASSVPDGLLDGIVPFTPEEFEEIFCLSETPGALPAEFLPETEETEHV